MQFLRDHYDYKLQCSDGTIETHIYLLKCLSDHFVATYNFNDEGKQLAKIDCGTVVMQSILDLLYYGWRASVTITAETCGEILTVCDYLLIRPDVTETIAEKLLNIALYTPDDVSCAHATIISMQPQVLTNAYLLRCVDKYTEDTIETILNIAKDKKHTWTAVSKIFDACSDHLIFDLFKEHRFLFDILFRDDNGYGPAVRIIKELTNVDDINYVYNVLIENLKYNGEDSIKHNDNLFKNLANKVPTYSTLKSVCKLLGRVG